MICVYTDVNGKTLHVVARAPPNANFPGPSRPGNVDSERPIPSTTRPMRHHPFTTQGAQTMVIGSLASDGGMDTVQVHHDRQFVFFLFVFDRARLLARVQPEV